MARTETEPREESQPAARATAPPPVPGSGCPGGKWRGKQPDAEEKEQEIDRHQHHPGDLALGDGAQHQGNSQHRRHGQHRVNRLERSRNQLSERRRRSLSNLSRRAGRGSISFFFAHAIAGGQQAGQRRVAKTSAARTRNTTAPLREPPASKIHAATAQPMTAHDQRLQYVPRRRAAHAIPAQRQGRKVKYQRHCSAIPRPKPIGVVDAWFFQPQSRNEYFSAICALAQCLPVFPHWIRMSAPINLTRLKSCRWPIATACRGWMIFWLILIPSCAMRGAEPCRIPAVRPAISFRRAPGRGRRSCLFTART